MFSLFVVYFFIGSAVAVGTFAFNLCFPIMSPGTLLTVQAAEVLISTFIIGPVYGCYKVCHLAKRNHEIAAVEQMKKDSSILNEIKKHNYLCDSLTLKGGNHADCR